MLESLTIRQIALIEEARIDFHRGMQVLTGETGAGKSIVVDAVNLVLGGRADRELIRSESQRASVEAVFSMNRNEKVAQFMHQEEIDYDGSTVTIYREITAGGKNTCRICGVLMPLAKLKELAIWLIDLHGQSEHQFLADPDRHLPYLDQSGDAKHQKLMHDTADACKAFLENHKQYARLVRQNEHREERMQSIERDLAELRKIHVRAGEADTLIEKRKELEKSARRAVFLNSIQADLSGNEDGRSGLGSIRRASDTLKTIISEELPQLSELSTRCESAYYELEEIAYQISALAEKCAADPESLERIDNRLDSIHRLERKHGTDANLLPDLEQKLEEEYRILSELETEITRMAAEHKRLLSEYRKLAKELTESRKKLSVRFEERIKNELQDLGMGHTQFKVDFKPNETGRPLMPSISGDDRIEFMISPNPGEPLKPLARIASGGELSRLMLALKTMESSDTGVESMVFDEIDTGISGRMAQAVAEKMITISRGRQVICVTHLPQIAAAADYQYVVRKDISGGRTLTSVTELNQQGRINEVARMISGADGLNIQSSEYATFLLNAAASKKQTIDDRTPAQN